MRLLLDTHVWLWTATEDARLTPRIRAAIADRANDIFVSAASVWEIAIKYQLGKLPLPLPPHDYETTMIARADFRTLAVTTEHAAGVAALPALHRDPFDRMLISQALQDDLTIVTIDPIVRSYAVGCIDA